MSALCLSKDLSDIINYFKQSLSNNNNEIFILDYVMENLTLFLENLYTILTLDDSLVDINVKLAVSISFKNVINDEFKRLNICNGKKLLQKVLEYLCQHNSLHNKIFKVVLLCIKPLINLINNEDAFIFELINKISLLRNPQNIEILYEISKAYVIKENDYENKVGQYIQSINNLFQNCISISQFNDNNYILIVDSLSCAYEFLENIVLETINKYKSKSIYLFSLLKPFIEKGIEIVYNQLREIIIVPQENNKDSRNNYLKKRIIQYIISSLIMIQHDENYIQQEIDLFEKIVPPTTQHLKIIVETKLLEIYNLKIYKNYTDNSIINYSICINKMLVLLSTVFKSQTLINQYKNDLPILFKNIILPFLIISEDEINMSLSKHSEDLHDYKRLIDDIIKCKNELCSIKSGNALLMKSLYTNQLMKKYIFNYLQLLYIKAFNVENYTLIENNNIMFQNDLILSTNIEHQKDLVITCLLIISQFQDDINNINKFKHLFEFSIHILLNKNLPVFIRYKILLLLKLYLPLFYESVNNGYKSIIDFLFHNFLDKEQQQELIRSQSCSVLLKEIKRLNIPPEIFKYYLPLFEERIKKTTKPYFFECLCEINLKLPSTSIDMELFQLLCKILDLRIYEHLKRKNQKQKNPYEHLILKCFNVIQTMLREQNEIFVRTNEEKICKCINYIYKYKKYYDEEFIILMGNFIRGIKKIPSEIEKRMENLMANLYKYIKYNGMTIHSYKIINCYIEYGVNTQKLDEYINTIFKLSMYEDNEQTSPFYMCSLLQIWMMKNKEINDNNQCFDNVVNFVIDKLIYLNMFDSYQQTDQYNYTAFLTLIYVALSKNFEHVFNLLKNKDTNNDILSTWNNKFLSFNIVCSYQFKIMILSIINIAKNVNLNISKLLTFGIHVLIKQLDTETTERKTVQNNYSFKKKKDTEYEYNEQNKVQYKIEKIEEMISYTINNMENIDEFRMFKQLITNLKQTNESGFNQWYGELTEGDKEKLNIISQIIRVEVKSNNKIEYISRKIVKIKKN